MPVRKSPREPIPGQVVLAGSLVTPGGEQGIPGPSAVSKDEGNIASIGSDGFIYVPTGTGGGGGGIEYYDLGHYAPLDAISTITDQTLAVYFNVSSSAKLKSVSFYKTANEAATINHSFQIWDTAGVPLWNHPPDADIAVEGWITHQLLVPLLLEVGRTYILGIHASNGYVNNTGHIPLTDGPLSATGSSRLTGNGPPIIPDTTPMHYGLDLVIEVEVAAIEEAPIDGRQYARQNASWTEVVSTGGGNVGIIDGSEPATGEVGEVLKSEIVWSHTGFTNATDQVVRILTLDVPAGDWLVWGYVDVLWTFGYTGGPEQPPMERSAGTLLTAPANGFIDVYEPGVSRVPHIYCPFCTNLSAINASPSNAKAGCVLQTRRRNSSSPYTFIIDLHMVMHFPAAPTMVGDYYGAPMLLAGIFARRMR